MTHFKVGRQYLIGVLLASAAVISAVANENRGGQEPAPPSAAEIQHVFWHAAVDDSSLDTAVVAARAQIAAGDSSPGAVAMAVVMDHQASRLAGAPSGEWVVASVRDSRGDSIVRLEQTFEGLKVFGAQLVVQLSGDTVVGVNGEYPTSPAVSGKPLMTSDAAGKAAAAALAFTRPTLRSSNAVIFNPALLDVGAAANRVSFMVVIGDQSRDADDTITAFIDAETGKLLHSFPNRETGRNRDIRELNGSQVLPGTSCYAESGAIGVPSADCANAFAFSGETYNYFLNTHGRDSFDAAGRTMRASVRFGSVGNAYWDGTQTVYGPQFATKDVVAHEWAHAVTHTSARLVYSGQSGALNESFSDIFGAMVDRDDWLMGEDLPGGAIRNLANPNQFGDPGKVSDSQLYCGTNDHGGVHTNSGVPNHAAQLMADGGIYNGRNVTGIGRLATERIFYRALTAYLTPGSSFLDAYNSLNSSCADLNGGSSSVTCTAVRTALQAVELDQPVCSGGGGTPDSFEDDDAFARASTYGSTQNHTFHDAGDQDWFKFTVSAGQNAVIQTAALQSNADTVLTLVGTNGTTVLADDDDGGGGRASRISYTFAAAGTYGVRVRQYTSSQAGASTGYTVTVTTTAGPSGGDSFEADNSAAAARDITPNGALQAHTYHVAGDHDWVKFTTTAGSQYTIQTESLAPASDTFLFLYAADGVTLLSADDDGGGGLASRIEWTASSAGQVFVRSRHYTASSFGSNTSYVLRVTTTGASPGSFEPNDIPSQATLLPAATTQSHTFYRPSDFDWVRFSASAGAPTVIETLNLGSASDTVLDVYGTDASTLIGSNDDNAGALASRVAFTPAASGTYYARVRHYSGAASGANTSYGIRVVSGDCTGGDAFEPDNTFGTARAIADNAVQNHALFCPGDQDWVTFNAVAGGEYTLLTSNLGSSSDTVMTLLNGDGTTVITTDDDSGGGFASRIVHVAQTTGIRFVRIRHFSAAAQGAATSYDLTLRSVVTNATADAYENDDTIVAARALTGVQAGHNFHTAGDPDFAVLAAAAGTSYVVETFNLGTRSDTLISVFGPGGLTNLVTTDDDSGGGRASRAVFTAGSSGNYYIRTTHFRPETFGAGTGYDLRVTAGAQPSGADAFENDNTSGLASVLAAGSSQRHNFHLAGDQDWTRFAMTAGSAYVIQTANLGTGADTYLELYDTNGSTLLSTNDDGGGGLASRISWTAQAGGNYFVRTRDYSSTAVGATTSYDLQLLLAGGGDAFETDNTPSQASTITVGAATPQLDHNFHFAGDVDWVRFTTTAGTSYVIETFDLGSSSDTVVGLYNPAATTLLAENDDFGGSFASRIDWTAPTSETYLLRIRPFNASAPSSNSSYDLRVTGGGACGVTDGFEPDNTSAQARSLLTGSANRQTHNFGCARDEDWQVFSATAGSRYRIETLNLLANSDTVMSLIAPDGVTVMAVDDDAGAGLGSLIEFTAAATGNHYVRSVHYNRAAEGSTTQYETQLMLLSSSGGDTFEPDDSSAQASLASASTTNTTRTQVGHNFHQAGDFDWVRFTATTGDICTLETSNLGGRADTFLEFYGTNPAGSAIASDDDSGSGLGSLLVRSSMTAGTNYARIRHFSSSTFGADTNYDFTVTCAPGTDVEPNNTAGTATLLTIGTAQRHQYGTPGDVDWFRFTATAGTSYVIETLNLASGSDTVLDLFASDGTSLITSNDDFSGLASRIVAVAPASGNLFVRSRHYFASDSGPNTAYDIRVRTGTSFSDDEEPLGPFVVTTATNGRRAVVQIALREPAAAVKVEAQLKQEMLAFVSAVPLEADGKPADGLRADEASWQQTVGDTGQVTVWQSLKPGAAGAETAILELAVDVRRAAVGGKVLVPLRLSRVGADGAVQVVITQVAIETIGGAPKIDSVTPATLGQETGGTISIRGENFLDTPKVSLWAGSSTSALVDVTLSLGGSAVTGTVPPGTKPGVYKIRLENPDATTTEFDGNFTVTTGGSACGFALSSSSLTLGPVVNTATIELTTGSACVWAAISSQSWLTVTSAADGTGSATLSVAATANSSGAARTATLTVGAATVEVNQSFDQAPTITTQPVAQTVAAGQAASFTTVATAAMPLTYQWQVSSNTGASWSNLTNGAPYSGVTTAVLSVASATADLNANQYRVVVSTSSGSATSAAARLTVLGPVTAGPAALRFGATASGTAIQSVTAPQTVTVTFSGAATAWTAVSNQSWLLITGGSGSTAGIFSAAVVASAVPAGSTTLSASITLTATGAPNSPITLPVTLAVSLGTGSPFGQVDTPLQNATGVVGAIGVTGWALDDVGVANVKIYRNCLPVDAGACQSIGGHSVVYIGDAAFVPGARSDLEGIFATSPQAYRAGWGYLMLTNMLPNVTSGLGYGGQGPLTIYAFATDMEGNRKLLGRAWSDNPPTPTAITMANATIAKPFGAIDTPGQGQTVSGTIPNFGWALTPDSNTSADGSDILIATNGSTMNVVIDGAAVGTVNYNQCRVGANPVLAGTYCLDDVASIFGNATPQPTSTPRSANATLFRNLDAGRAAIGAFDIDTTLMTNGRHSIAWGVTDSAGRAEGIGSRDFIVLNGSSLMADPTTEMADAAAMAVGRVADLADLASSEAAVTGRTGFDMLRATEVVMADADGVRHVTMPELGRLELWLGDGVTAGYLVANTDLRPLPPGSWLDAASGRFTWGPLVGYIGPYDLAFRNGDGLIRVRVTLQPKSAETAGLMRGYIDAPVAAVPVTGAFTVAGWALDLGAWQGSGVGAVHVWAQRLDTAATPVQFLGAAEIGERRPDVAAAFGAQFDGAGWQLAAPGLAPGSYEITAYFWNTRTARFEDARTVTVTVR